MFFDYRCTNRSILKSDYAPALVEEVIQPIWEFPYPKDNATRLSFRWRFVRKPQRLIYAVVWLEREVSNGGFAQYFSNPLGFFYEDVREACRVFRIPKLDTIVTSAATVFPAKTPSKVRNERMQILGQLAAPLRSAIEDDGEVHELTILNDRVFKQQNSQIDAAVEGMFEPIASYIRAHPNEFFR